MTLCPPKNPPANDVVMTPPSTAKSIIDHFAPHGYILDPSRGEGAFYDNFPSGCQKDYCEISEGKDFFDYTTKVDWIITNPPWSIMRAWLNHSYELADNIVLLCTLTHFVTKARLREMNKAGFGLKEGFCIATPPKPWPASGFQVAAVHLARGYEGPWFLTGDMG